MSYSVKIIVATHKEYEMPVDEMYLPLYVGADSKIDKNGEELSIGYTKDNTGDNISYLNPSFCELTGLYWAWKNIKSDYNGLVHYRRHFSIKKRKKGFCNVLTKKELEPYLGKVRVFVPKKRRYFIETLYSHYKHTHYEIQLKETEKIIREIYPDYVDSYNRVIKRTYGYMFNMMIMDKKLLDDYCEWLFNILFVLKVRVEMPELTAFQGRFFGRISEIIFNVWLDKKLKNGELEKNQIMEFPYKYMEKINWKKKIKAFLFAKFFKKKYEGSF